MCFISARGSSWVYSSGWLSNLTFDQNEKVALPFSRWQACTYKSQPFPGRAPQGTIDGAARPPPSPSGQRGLGFFQGPRELLKAPCKKKKKWDTHHSEHDCRHGGKPSLIKICILLGLRAQWKPHFSWKEAPKSNAKIRGWTEMSRFQSFQVLSKGNRQVCLTGKDDDFKITSHRSIDRKNSMLVN